MRFIAPILLCVFLASCSSATTSKPVGTGEYVNSVYTSKVSKDIQSGVYGAPNSKVQLTIFSDYQCPACINLHEMIDTKLWKDYIDTKKITVTFKNFPLTIPHANAEGDALAGLCALSSGKFKEFRNEMYAVEEAKKGAAVTDDERAAAAKKAGITDPNFKQCVTEAWYQKRLEAEMKDGERLGLQGTPSVYLGDTILNFTTPEEFFGILDAALK